jgi:hypothetical protein
MMPQFPVAIHLPEDFNPADAAADVAMGRAIDELNKEMSAARIRKFVTLKPAGLAKSLRAPFNGKVLVTDGPYIEA